MNSKNLKFYIDTYPDALAAYWASLLTPYEQDMEDQAAAVAHFGALLDEIERLKKLEPRYENPLYQALSAAISHDQSCLEKVIPGATFKIENRHFSEGIILSINGIEIGDFDWLCGADLQFTPTKDISETDANIIMAACRKIALDFQRRTSRDNTDAELSASVAEFG